MTLSDFLTLIFLYDTIEMDPIPFYTLKTCIGTVHQLFYNNTFPLSWLQMTTPFPLLSDLYSSLTLLEEVWG